MHLFCKFYSDKHLLSTDKEVSDFVRINFLEFSSVQKFVNVAMK